MGRQLTQQDLNELHNVIGPELEKLEVNGKYLDNSAENAQRFTQILEDNAGIAVNLQSVLGVAKNYPQYFVWVSAPKHEYDQLAEEFTEQERNYIAGFLDKQGLWGNGEDSDLTNFNLVARRLVENTTTFTGGLTRGMVKGSDGKQHRIAGKKLPVTLENLNRALGQVNNTPQHNLLHYRPGPRKFNPEQAEKDQAEKRKTFQKNEQEVIKTDGDFWYKKYKPSAHALPKKT